MNQVNSAIQSFDYNMNNMLQNYLQRPTLVKGIIHFLLILYAARIAPVPPVSVLRLFDNVYFKLFVCVLILWTSQFSPSTSILIALAFMMTINYTTTGKLWEMMENVANSTSVPVPGSPASPVTESTAVTPNDSIQAINILSKAASSPAASDPSSVNSVMNVALANITTENGSTAIQMLGQQAVVAEAGLPVKVSDTTQTAIAAIGPSNSSGCYPPRAYDMSKVQGQMDGNKATFEDYQPFSPTE